MAKRFGKRGKNPSCSIVIVFALFYLGGMVLAVLLPIRPALGIAELVTANQFVLPGLFFFLLLFFSAFSIVGALLSALTSFFVGAIVAVQVLEGIRPFSLWALLRLAPLVCLLAPAFVLYSARCAASSLLLTQKLLQFSSDQQLGSAIHKQLMLSVPIFLIVMVTALLYQLLL